jgi:hypothetical protein
MVAVGAVVSAWLVGVSATVLHPDQFSNESYSEPATDHIVSVVRFRSLPDQVVGVFNPRDPGRGQMQPSATMAEPVWERGEHKLIVEMPQAQPETGRPLTQTPARLRYSGASSTMGGKGDRTGTTVNRPAR